ncbi:MAG: class I tRNA ligase family protein, partial [Ostreibacterium sp.]
VTIGKIEKMSKSKNNGADPQVLIDQYGADTIRLFIAFAAPPEQSLEWSDTGVEGANRYLKKVWSYAEKYQSNIVNASDEVNLTDKALQTIRREIYQALQQAIHDFSRQQFNTVVSACMKIYNAIAGIEQSSEESNTLRREGYRILLLLLSPITPHIAHTLWIELVYQGNLLDTAWPVVNDKALAQSEIEIIVQVSGKMRGKIIVSLDASKESIIETALSNENVSKFTVGKTVIKTIVVPKKLINIVTKD